MKISAAIVLSVALLCGAALVPLGGHATGLLTIFEPKSFVPLDVTRADLRDLRLAPDFKELGTSRVVQRQSHASYDSLAAARSHISFPVRTIAAVPAQFRSAESFDVMTPGEYAFTFSAAKTRAFAARAHRRIPPMPPGLDGTTVRIHIGEIFHARYGRPRQRGSDRMQSLQLVEMQAPSVSSTGASLALLEQYILSLPNISPKLAAQIRALGDLNQTLPIPVVIDRQTAQRVTVDGVQGLSVGDNTGLGAGVIWERNGIVYGIAGPLRMDDVLAFANELR